MAIGDGDESEADFKPEDSIAQVGPPVSRSGDQWMLSYGDLICVVDKVHPVPDIVV